MPQPGSHSANCPECQATNRPGRTVCFLCGHRLDGGSSKLQVPGKAKTLASSDEFTNPYAVAEAPRAAGYVFNLNSLLLVIALIAVCLGVIQQAPGLGVPLAVVSFIALARTMSVSASRGDGGQPLTALEKLAVFFATISMAFVVVFCIVIALFATCYAVCAVSMINSDPNSLWALGIPFVLFVVAMLIWGSWRLLGRLRQVASIRRGKPDDGPAPLVNKDSGDA